MNPFHFDIADILLIILVTLLIFLAIREVICWYWKINAAIYLKREHNAIMDDILQELRTITEVIKYKNDPSERIVKKEETIQESTILN